MHIGWLCDLPEVAAFSPSPRHLHYAEKALEELGKPRPQLSDKKLGAAAGVPDRTLRYWRHQAGFRSWLADYLNERVNVLKAMTTVRFAELAAQGSVEHAKALFAMTEFGQAGGSRGPWPGQNEQPQIIIAVPRPDYSQEPELEAPSVERDVMPVVRARDVLGEKWQR